MPVHTLAFRTTSLGTTVNTQLNAVADNVIQRQSNNFLPQTANEIIAAWISSADIARGRLQMPSFNLITQPYIRPTNGTAILPGTIPKLAMYGDNPIRTPALEQIEMQITDGTGSTTGYGALWLRQGVNPAPFGTPYTYRGISTTAAVAGVWTPLTVTYDNDIPAGEYSVIGFSHMAANNLFARINFEGQNYRPGCVSIITLDNKPSEFFWNGAMGEWGRFRNTSIPIIEVLNNSTDAVHEIYLQIIRTGP